MLIVLSLLLLILAVAVPLFVLSPQGTALVIEYAAERFPFEVDEVRGSLLGQLCARQVRVDTTTVEILVTDVCIDPRLWESIDFLRVDLELAEAQRVTISLPTGTPPEEPEPFTPPALPVGIFVDALKVERLDVVGQTIRSIDGTLALAPGDLVATLALRYADIPIVLATEGPLRDFRAEVEALLEEGRMEGSLGLDLSEPTPFLVAEMRSDELAAASLIGRELVLGSVEARMSGTLDEWEYAASASVQDPDLTSALFRISGSGSTSAVTFAADLMAAQAPGYGFSDGSLALEGEVPLAAPLVVPLRGRLRAGRLHDVPLTGSFDARVAADTIALDQVSVALTSPFSGSLTVTGEVGLEERGLDLGFDARSLPLQAVDELVSGSVSGTGRLKGPFDEPRLDGTVRVVDFEGRGLKAETATLETSATLSGMDVSLEIEDPVWRLDTRFRVAGDLEAATVELESLAAGLQESAVGPVAVDLRSPTRIDLASSRVAVDGACVIVTAVQTGLDPGSLCLTGRYPEGGALLELETLRVEGYELTPDVRVGGALSGRVEVQTFAPLKGLAALSVQDIYADYETRLSLGDLSLEALLDDDRLSLDVSTPVATQNLAIEGSAELALAEPVIDSPIEGKFQIFLDGIWLAESLLPMDVTLELDDLAGKLTADLEVSGLLSDPGFRGQARLSEAGWMVPAINTRFQDLAVSASVEPGGPLALEGRGTVGDGDLRVDGSLDLAGELLTATVAIDRVRAVDLPDYSATIDGGLDLEMTTDRINVKGALALPEATITISELPETAVGVSSDEVVVGEARRTQQNRRTRVSLTLGDYVRFKAFGLDTRLVGELELREAPGVPPELVGTIELREGLFESYGQSFAIERGLLIFSGPIDNPEVDVVASQTVRHGDRDVLISLDITGTASALTTTIRSMPAMPEADAVSLLLTGRTISELSTQEQTNVYGAALSLGLMGARGLTDNLGAQLGLEEIILDQDPTGDVRVGAAIRINKDLYFRYTYGAFSRIGGALLRYRLTDRLSLQGQTGDTHSIEVRYGVD